MRRIDDHAFTGQRGVLGIPGQDDRERVVDWYQLRQDRRDDAAARPAERGFDGRVRSKILQVANRRRWQLELAALVAREHLGGRRPQMIYSFYLIVARGLPCRRR